MEIIDLGPDEIITAPGFYRLPLARHHAQPCMAPERLQEILDGDTPTLDDDVSVTSGVLRTMELATPADVWAFHLLNPERFPKPETDALRMGRAMAAYIEGGMAQVESEFFVLPDDKPRRPSPQQMEAYENGTATEAGVRSVEFWREVESRELPPLSNADVEMIENMGRVLVKDALAVHVMSGEPEVTMAVQDERTGLWLLSRPDTVSFDGVVSDFKRMAASGRPFNYRLVDRRITDHAYDMQLAFAAEAFEALTGAWPGLAAIIAQMTTPPFHVIAREISEEDLRRGQFRNRRAITRFAECLDSGHWPGPGEDVGVYQRPAWQVEQLVNEMQIGAVE